MIAVADAAENDPVAALARSRRKQYLLFELSGLAGVLLMLRFDLASVWVLIFWLGSLVAKYLSVALAPNRAGRIRLEQRAEILS